MGSESSVPERPGNDPGASDHSRSGSPRPRYDNDQGSDDGMNGLPRFSSTMPLNRTDRSDSLDPQLRAASEPNDDDMRGKSKKKKRKKKKPRSFSAGEDTARLEPPDVPLAAQLPIDKSARGKRRGTRKNAQAPESIDEEGAHLRGADAEGPLPSLVNSPGKRERRSSNSSKSHKSKIPELASPFEAVGPEYKRFGAPNGHSLVAGHLDGNTQVVASIYERQSQQASNPARFDALRTLQPSQQTQPSSYQWVDDEEEPAEEQNGSEGELPSTALEAGREHSVRQESIETASRNSPSHPISRDVRVDSPPLEESEHPPQSGQMEPPSDMDIDGVPHSSVNGETKSTASDGQTKNTRNHRLSIEPESPVIDGDANDDASAAEDTEMLGVGSSPALEDAADDTAEEPSLELSASAADNVEEPPAEQLEEDEAESGSSVDGEPFDVEIAQASEPEVEEVNPASQTVSARARRVRTKQTEDVYEPNGPPDKPARVDRSANGEATNASSPPRSSIGTSKSSRATRRKPKTPFFVRESDEGQEIAQAFSELPEDEIAATPATRREKKPKASQNTQKPRTKSKTKKTSAQDPGDETAPKMKGQYHIGPLTALEEKQVRSAIDAFRDTEGLTEEEIVQVIHTNPQSSKKGSSISSRLWTAVNENCPTRPRQKLINWSRHNYHNYVARGRWDKEQDDELAAMVEKYGKKWTQIGGLINRHPSDVRDRYRNYIVCRDTVKYDYWDKEEVDQLYETVQETVNRIRQDKTINQNDNEAIEGLINWQMISEAMGSTRNRLQCMTKWKQLGETREIPKYLEAVLPSSSSRRVDATRKNLRRITAKDKFLLARSVRDSKAKNDHEIPWTDIVKDLFEDRYERKALMVTWARLRETVPDHEEKSTRACAKHICAVFEEEEGFEDEDVREAEGAAPSQKSSPEKNNTRASTEAARTTPSARKAKGQRIPLPSNARKITSGPAPRTPVGRLSHQVMARTFGSKKLQRSGTSGSGNVAVDVEQEELVTDVVEESPQEDVNAPPEESSTEASDHSEDEEPTRNAAANEPIDRHERATSIDLGVEPAAPPSSSLPPSSQPSRSQPRTYSSKNKKRYPRTAADKADKNAKVSKDKEVEGTSRDEAMADDSESVEAEDEAVETPNQRKRGRAAESSADAKGKKSHKAKRRGKRAVIDDQELMDEEIQEPRVTPRRPTILPVGLSASANGAKSRKRKENRVEEVVDDSQPENEPQEDVAQTPTRTKRSRPGDPSPVLSGTPSPAKKRKTAEGTARNGWNAINTSSKRNPNTSKRTQPVDVRSEVSSDMDDMDDIPAKLPGLSTQMEEEGND